MTALSISRKSHYRSEQDFDRLGKTRTTIYDANGINQYATITRGETPFIPTFDADGNQTLVQSSTGIWTVVYNAENRPISFTKTEADQTSTIECGYDYMGRRFTKKVTVNGAITLHQRYIYRGYLQIACVDLLRGGHPALWYTLWDPTEPIATRPLAIQKNGTWYTYGHDLTKNVTELYNADGTIATSYDYTPFGAVTVTGIEQAFQWSSEFYDDELALTYYNYRHYNPLDGRWIGRDLISSFYNDYVYLINSVMNQTDWLGLEQSQNPECPNNTENKAKESDNDKNKKEKLPPADPKKVAEIVEKATEHEYGSPETPKKKPNVTIPVNSKTPKITPPKTPDAPSKVASIGKGVKQAIGSSSVGAALNVARNVDNARKIGAGIICVKGRLNSIKDLSDLIDGKDVDVVKREKDRRKIIDAASRAAQD